MIFKKKQSKKSSAKGKAGQTGKKIKLPPIAKVVRPGAQVTVVLNVDLMDEVIDARSTTLHVIDKKGHLILAQTEPPLTERRVGQVIDVSFLARNMEDPEMPWLRLGYSTKLLSIINNVRLGEDLVDNVLVVDGPKRLKPTTVRLYFRLEPRADDGFEVYVEPDHLSVTLEDISAGGLRFSHSPSWRLTKGQSIFMNISQGAWRSVVEGRVVRTSVINLGKGRADRPDGGGVPEAGSVRAAGYLQGAERVVPAAAAGALRHELEGAGVFLIRPHGA